MMTGRPPKPTSLKVLHGDRKDRINFTEPKPADAEIRCPTWLEADAKRVWRRLAPDLIRTKVLRSWDVDAFASLCSTIVVNRRALTDLAEHGNVIVVLVREMADGSPVYVTQRNPNWQVAKESAQIIATLGGRFGLNPSDRSRLSVGEAPGAKGAERLLSG